MNADQIESIPLMPWLSEIVKPFYGSRCIGTRVDENGVEHEVWEHTYMPPGHLTSEEMNALFANMNAIGSDPSTLYISKKNYKDIKRAVAVGRRYDRAKRLKRRQRRAHQRRHHRGEA